ncbi:GTPase MTG2 [Colletotrichum sp. SAR 10_99]|nr:GTPase MTG2 [Colletotrichum sp. SAR 10_96]KAJ5011711.1 GTPase MTG2 [Colletotrichum sp. SAR 10_99]
MSVMESHVTKSANDDAKDAVIPTPSIDIESLSYKGSDVRSEDDGMFSPIFGEFAWGDETDIDKTIASMIKSRAPLPQQAIDFFAFELVPDCIGLAVIYNTLVIELPETDFETFHRRLATLTDRICAVPFLLHYNNGPLPNSEHTIDSGAARNQRFLSMGWRYSKVLSSTHVAQEPPSSRLNPAPDDYASPNFADKASLTLYAGPGGHGCISFMRDAYLPDGPPNGGDGGHGGNIYIQAVHGETSLHKLARRRFIRAGRGKTGQGSAKGGQRGEDVIITVPVGTVLRELEREDPVAEEAVLQRALRAKRKAEKRAKREREEELARRELVMTDEEIEEDRLIEEERKAKKPEPEDDEPEDPERHKWLLYPGLSKSDLKTIALPKAPRRQRLYHQPPGPIQIDLSRPSPQPILLATGGVGGLGNPHFVSREFPRPIFATKGERAVTMQIELELKLLADVGLVGLPNAGKSTLLRALTNSRTRVGNWAFTTLQPNIGTVVLDNYKGRPVIKSYKRYPAAASSTGTHEEEVRVEQRTRFTVADIPGLIEGAHLDRGLGMEFLRHVERAAVLAFVIDLSAGPAVKALDALWREVGLYAQMREEEERDREVDSRIDWDLASNGDTQRPYGGNMMIADAPETPKEESGLHITAKPWFVVATKADLPETQENFKQLKEYLEKINNGTAPHPSGVEKGTWTENCAVIPVSAIHGQGVDRIVHWTVGLLDE